MTRSAAAITGEYWKRFIPQIKIQEVTYANQVLSFVVSDFKIRDQVNADDPAAVPVIKLPVRLQVFNQEAKNIFDGVQMFELAEKEARGQKVKLQVTFPRVVPGVYSVIIWVGDLLTGKRDMAVKTLTIPGSE